MSSEQIVQKQEIEKQRDELNRQYRDIKNLQSQISFMEAISPNNGLSRSHSSHDPDILTQLRHGYPSPSNERYSPVQSTESRVHSLYSSSPVDQYGSRPSGMAMPQLPPRRRITVSEQELRYSMPTTPSTFTSSGPPTAQLNYIGSQTNSANNFTATQAQNKIQSASTAMASASGGNNSPFHALAAASGVVLPENVLSGAQFFTLLLRAEGGFFILRTLEGRLNLVIKYPLIHQ